jgi:hypothetical protein
MDYCNCEEQPLPILIQPPQQRRAVQLKGKAHLGGYLDLAKLARPRNLAGEFWDITAESPFLRLSGTWLICPASFSLWQLRFNHA